MTANSIARVVSVGGFFLLFPGFVIYHYFISASIIPPVAGGLFGPVALVLAVIYLTLLPLNLRGLLQANSLYTVVVAGFLLYVLLITLAHYASYNLSFIQLAGKQSFGVIVFWISLFFLGFYLPHQSRFLQVGSFICAAAITGFLVYYVATTGSLFFYAAELYGVEEGVSTYQGFARSSLGLWALLVVTARSELYRWFMVISGIFALFVLGARSELFAFMALSLLLMMALGMRSVKALLLAVVASGVITALVISNLDALMESRQMQILDLRTSSSWNAREVLEAEAWEVIKSHPIWGSFGYHVTRGTIGSYAHNYLSAWENDGLIGVTAYLMLTIVACLMGAYHCFGGGSRFSIYWLLSFVMNTICLILIVFSKPVFWPLVALGWGLHARAVGEAQTRPVVQRMPQVLPPSPQPYVKVQRSQ